MLVCVTWRVPRSCVCALVLVRQPGEHGPKTDSSDEGLVTEIRTVPLVGESVRGPGGTTEDFGRGLAARGSAAGKNRAQRADAEEGDAAAGSAWTPAGRPESGRPDPHRSVPTSCGGTDAARPWTRRAGWCWFFSAMDELRDRSWGLAGGEEGGPAGRPLESVLRSLALVPWLDSHHATARPQA